MEGLFKILFTIISISMLVICIPPIYCIGVLWLMYCDLGNIINLVKELNDELKKEVFIPVFELFKEMWGA